MNSRSLNLNIYTLKRPPTQENPYLNPSGHEAIINYLSNKGNAYHCLNSEGEVDFYFCIPYDDYDFLEETEEIGVNIPKDDPKRVEVIFDDGEFSGAFIFRMDDPLDTYSLSWLILKKRVNIYYVCEIHDEFVCMGIKNLYLPFSLCYDLQRYQDGKKQLYLPRFDDRIITSSELSTEIITSKAWAFYVDYGKLLKQTGNADEVEEIISRHLLHGIAKIQRSRKQTIRGDSLLFWVGKKIMVNDAEEPAEYYSVYISSLSFTGSQSQDYAATLMKRALEELSGGLRLKWIEPLGEEALPLVLSAEHRLHKIHLTLELYERCHGIFQSKYCHHRDYIDYYQQLIRLQGAKRESKVHDIFERKGAKAPDIDVHGKLLEENDLQHLINVINKGDERDLPEIFNKIVQLKPREIDEVLINLYDKFRDKSEPYLLSLISSPHYHLMAAGILGVGMIESKNALPVLIDKLRGKKEEANLAKYALALIGESSIQYLLPLLEDKKAEYRVRAIETLTLIGAPAAINSIRSLKKDRSARVEEARRKALDYNQGQSME